jgi:sulfur carrier protein ThiS
MTALRGLRVIGLIESLSLPARPIALKRQGQFVDALRER